jgi:hypothetical protein
MTTIESRKASEKSIAEAESFCRKIPTGCQAFSVNAMLDFFRTASFIDSIRSGCSNEPNWHSGCVSIASSTWDLSREEEI